MATTIERLAETWANPTGALGWLTQVNHKAVGLRFIGTALVLFLLAGASALLMRLQLAWSDLQILPPGLYNQLFTMHGSTMMFLVAVPLLEGLAILIVPLMIGARDMAFPRLNAFGYWVYLLAAIALYAGLLVGQAPDGGWFNYVPLSGPAYSPGIGIDLWLAAITFLEISALVAAVELIVTILKMRAPGMTINRVPLFVWSILVMSLMIAFAMPPLMLASVMLELDRAISTHFFNPAAGGDPFLWQHLFWVFGHPDVYIIVIPALGIISTLIPVFARRPIFGYLWIVVAQVAIGFLSFGLWVHHMFAGGLPAVANSFFAAASMLIAIPNGVQFICWLLTLWGGRIRLVTPMLYVLGFVVIFLIGGLTGPMLAAVPFDLQVHDTYFVVAHFHYVLIGGAIFPIFGGLYYWFPKFSGRQLSERLGQLGFWLQFIGFNLTFFIMHLTGLLGMPRRVYTYLPGLGWEWPNLISTVGAGILGLGFLVLLWDFVRAWRSGPAAPDNPWGASTLEWATSSPPAPYNFPRLPAVDSLDPLWANGSPATVRIAEELVGPGRSSLMPVVARVDLPTWRRETVGTTVIDAVPEQALPIPGPSIWPLCLALAVGVIFFGGILVDLLFVPIGAVLSVIALLGWLWPDRAEAEQRRAAEGGQS